MNEFIDQFLSGYTKFKETWNYEDGCVLLGAQRLYEATGEAKYFDFIENYLKDFVCEDGTIKNYDITKYNIDSVNPSKVLFFMYDKTGEEKYRGGIEQTMNQLREHPRTKCGNFFHKKIYPNQIWLDGLFMGQPFYMAYTTKFDGKRGYDDILNQYRNVQKYLWNDEKHLCYHGYDESKSIFWADKENGCSQNFWLRSMGWYLISLVDVLDETDKQIYEKYRELVDIFKLNIKGILEYQDKESKLFYQVIDRPEVEGNYLETSGSVMIAYAILKACRLGILNKEKYQQIGLDILKQIEDTKIYNADGKWHISGSCSVAGLGPADNPRRDGTIEYYLSEPITDDDTKCAGIYMCAVAERIRIKQ